jgi:hypothetical protein
MPQRKAPYWETPLDLFKFLLTAAAIWAFLGPLGGCSAMTPSADLPDTALPELNLSGDSEDADSADAADAAVDADDAESDAGDDTDTVSSSEYAVTATIAPLISGRESQLAPGANIEGTTAPGARLMSYDGDTPLGEFLADADGNWSFTLPEGFRADSLNFRVVVVDADGAELGEDTRSLRILPAGLPKTGRWR